MSPQPALLPVVSAWLGGDLSYLEILCLTSMVKSGHRTILYCYEEVRGVPPGVEVRDASNILPVSEFQQYKNGSYALGSNLFRYNLFNHYNCIWLDTDMYLLRPIETNSDYIFGWEDANYINTAVLSLPKKSSLLNSINALISNSPFYGPWWDADQIEQQNLAVKAHAAIPLAELPWATIGPKLVTYFAKKHGVADKACSPEVFYPVHWRNFLLPFQSGNDAEKCMTENTIGLHFWNHMLGSVKSSPHPHSLVAQLCEKHGVELNYRSNG